MGGVNLTRQLDEFAAAHGPRVRTTQWMNLFAGLADLEFMAAGRRGVDSDQKKIDQREYRGPDASSDQDIVGPDFAVWIERWLAHLPGIPKVHG
jgi:hypothetical protein